MTNRDDDIGAAVPAERRSPLPSGWAWGLAIFLAIALAFVFGTGGAFSLIGWTLAHGL